MRGMVTVQAYSLESMVPIRPVRDGAATRGLAVVKPARRWAKPFHALTYLAAIVTSVAAHASGSLSITYFEVAASKGGPDFGGSGTPNIAIGSALGPNGFPVVDATAPGVSDYSPTTHELTWWGLSAASPAVFTGSSTVSMPYARNMFAPNSTGVNDTSFYETAILSGTISVPASETVSLTVASDDDTYIYIDGKLAGKNPGIHGVSTVTFTSPVLSTGSHPVKIFYADREKVAASLSVTLNTANAVINAPEPTSLLLLASGTAGLAAACARRPRKVRANAEL